MSKPIAVLQGNVVFLFETMPEAIAFMDHWDGEGFKCDLVAVVDRR